MLSLYLLKSSHADTRLSVRTATPHRAPTSSCSRQVPAALPLDPAPRQALTRPLALPIQEAMAAVTVAAAAGCPVSLAVSAATATATAAAAAAAAVFRVSSVVSAAAAVAVTLEMLRVPLLMGCLPSLVVVVAAADPSLAVCSAVSRYECVSLCCAKHASALRGWTRVLFDSEDWILRG